MTRHIGYAALALLIALQSASLGAAGSPVTIVDAAKAGNLEAVRVFLKQPKAANVATRDGTIFSRDKK